MSTTMPLALTKEHIQDAVDGLPPQHRAMIRLLLLQYLDLSEDDIKYMAIDRPDPRIQLGHQVMTQSLSRDAVESVTERSQQYRGQVRQRRERIWLQIQCLTKQVDMSEAICRVAEDLLRTRFGFTSDALNELKQGARIAIAKPAVRALEKLWDKDEIQEEDYRKARLPIEYQAEIRRRIRYRTRLNLAQREFDTVGFVPLQDHEIAHIWGIPMGSLAGRKVKSLHQYLQTLQAKCQGDPVSPGAASAPPVDYWKQTFEVLSKTVVERSVAVYDGMEGSEAALLDKLTAFATGKLQDEVDSRLWQAISRDYSPNAVEGQGVRQSLFALQRLLAILNEMDMSPEAREEQLLAKISPKPKVAPGEEVEQAPVPQLGDMAEHVLRSMRGEERG